MSYTISTLLTRNLQDVFGENDPARRRAAIDELWTEDAVFYDPIMITDAGDKIWRDFFAPQAIRIANIATGPQRAELNSGGAPHEGQTRSVTSYPFPHREQTGIMIRLTRIGRYFGVYFLHRAV